MLGKAEEWKVISRRPKFSTSTFLGTKVRRRFDRDKSAKKRSRPWNEYQDSSAARASLAGDGGSKPIDARDGTIPAINEAIDMSVSDR